MKFIRLRSHIINPLSIQYIQCLEKQYAVFLKGNHQTGVHFFGTGIMMTEPRRILITKDQADKDYEVMTRWIEENTDSHVQARVDADVVWVLKP